MEMQKPTSEAIKEQVSLELDEQLPGQVSELVVESALKTGSKRKRKGSAKRRNRSKKEPPHKTLFKILIWNRRWKFPG